MTSNLSPRLPRTALARTACCLSAAVLLAGTAAAQEMPRPDYKIGDRWVYRETDLLTKAETGRVTEAVHSIADDAIWLDRMSGGGRNWVRVDPKTLTPLERSKATGDTPSDRGKIWATNDGGCAWPWPLKVGMQFDCKEKVLLTNGETVRYDLAFTVEAFEPVEVPAGRFEAFKLVGKGSLFNETKQTTAPPPHARIVWLAPAAKREVRYEIRTLRANSGKPSRVEGRELVEFKVGAAN